MSLYQERKISLTTEYIACSKRSDNGERCEVTHRSPLSERLEQATEYRANFLGIFIGAVWSVAW